MPRAARMLEDLRAAVDARLGIEGPVCWLGNRCGHLSGGDYQPYLPPPNHEPRPQVLRFFVQRFARFYYAPLYDPFCTLVRANHRERQMRDERREACVKLMEALIHHTDITTLRVAKKHDNDHQKLRGLSMLELAELSGLHCLRRCERAMQDLHAAGIVGVHRIAKPQADGTYRGRAAIRTIFSGIFEALGLGKRLEKERGKKSREAREAETKPPVPASMESGIAKLAWQAAKRAVGIRSPGPEPPELEDIKPGTAH